MFSLTNKKNPYNMLDETNRRCKMRRFYKDYRLGKTNHAVIRGFYERSHFGRKRMYGTAVFKYLPEIWM